MKRKGTSKGGGGASTTTTEVMTQDHHQLTPEERLEAEELESRRALSMSIMHHAVQASSVKGSADLSYFSSKSRQSDQQQQPSSNRELGNDSLSHRSDGMNDKSIAENSQQTTADASGWNLMDSQPNSVQNLSQSLGGGEFHDYYSLGEDRKVIHTRNRRVCMYICALLGSSFISIFLGSARLGFSGVHDMKQRYSSSSQSNEERTHYHGNYTDSTATTTSTTSNKESGVTKTNENKYELPNNINEDDDFVNMDTILPTVLDTNVGDVFDAKTGKKVLLLASRDIPLFWVVPRSGGNVIRYILSYCFRSVLACEAGAGHEEQKVLEVFEEDGCDYVNVNMESSKGIQRARDLNLVNSGLAYAIFSSRLNEVISLFHENHPARAFTVLRHPVDIAISRFYQEQARNPKLALVTLEQHLNDQNTAGIRDEFDNFMVRSLANKPDAIITTYDLELAMVVLKRKFIVGLADHMAESIRRFRLYFNWKTKGLKGIDQCIDTFNSPSPRKKPNINENSAAYKILKERNKWDVKLYDYARHLFDVQGLLLQK